MIHPFLSLYTPTYRRPQGLIRCLESVRTQTAVDDIQQIVVPDHLGVGIAGMYQQVRLYADAILGQYVTFLCDDDVLAGPTVVSEVRDFAQQNQHPPVLLVDTEKGGSRWPADPPWPPQLGSIDLNCLIVRVDVWKRHVHAYGARYEGDWDFANALHQSGLEPIYCDVLFSRGDVSRGAMEAA